MYAWIKGSWTTLDRERIIVKTSYGLGMEIRYPEALRAELGEIAEFFLSHIVRENSELLYGFSELQNKAVFEKLLSVKGVGPRSAYQLIATLGSESLARAISQEDKKLLCSVPGIGPKAAAQILLDLKSKLDSFLDLPLDTKYENVSQDWGLQREGIEACEELGLKREHILPIVNRLLSEQEFQSSSELVKAVLQSHQRAR